MGKPIEIKIVNQRPKDKPYGDLMMPLLGEGVTQARMQDPGSGVELVPAPEPMTAPNNVPRLEPGTGPSGHGRSARATCSARRRTRRRPWSCQLRHPAARAPVAPPPGRPAGTPRRARESLPARSPACPA